MMKKINKLIIFIIACCLISLFAIPLTAVADEIYSDIENPYIQFVNFVTSHPNRTIATDNEENAAIYIANQLSGMGYGNTNDLIVPFNFQEREYFYYSVVEAVDSSSNNVVAYKRSSANNAKLLVIGAYYGNLANRMLTTTQVIGGEGALNNGTGVGTLLAIAARLSTVELPFDVAFAFFGAEYIEYAGSKYFLEENEQEILGMINLIGVGGGDNLYVYYDEIERTHGAFLNNIINTSDYNILSAPNNRKLINTASYAGLPYTHKGLEASNAIFMAKGIPSVNIFGYNWDGVVASESAIRNNVSGTGEDTLENFLASYSVSEIQLKLNNVTAFVVEAVQTEYFSESFENALDDKGYTAFTGSVLYLILKLVLIIGVVIAVILLSARANKITANASAETKYDNILNDNQDDIFELNDNDNSIKEEKEEKDDDIFNEF